MTQKKPQQSPSEVVLDFLTTDPIRNYQKTLPHLLTLDELRVCGQEMATTYQEIVQEEMRQADIKAQMKAKIAELESTVTRLAAIINSKTEYRLTRVEVWPLGEDGHFVREVRTDTGEIIAEREITDAERQPDLPAV